MPKKTNTSHSRVKSHGIKPQETKEDEGIYTPAMARFILSFIIPILGLIFSIYALCKIKENKNLKGREYAFAGLVISVLIMLIIASRFL